MKRLQRSIICVVFSTIFLLSTIPASAASVTMTDAQFIALMDAQQNALEANVILKEHLVSTDGEYPEYFGGVYIEDNILRILLANPSPEITAWIAQILSNYTDWVKIEIVDYSYNYLYSLAQSYAESAWVTENPETVTGFYVDAKGNEAVITVCDEIVAEKSEASVRTALPIRFECAGGTSFTPSVTTSNSQGNTNRSISAMLTDTISLKGGMQINNSTYRTTIAICGTYNSLPAFVTCGHDQDGNAWTRLGSTIGSGSIIAAPTYVRYSDGVNGDFSIHTVNDGMSYEVETTNKIQNVSLTTNDVAVVGVYDDPVPGTYLFKYNTAPIAGSTDPTRYRSYCLVENTGVTLLSSTGTGGNISNVRVNNLTSMKYVYSDGTSIFGDSGGPVFMISGGQTSIAGVFHGVDNSDLTRTYFTPLKYVIAAGFTPLTN